MTQVATDTRHRRSQRTIKLVIETAGLTPEDHERTIRWAEKNIVDANWNMKDVHVSVVIMDESGHVKSYTGNGKPSPETEDIIKDLVGDDDD